MSVDKKKSLATFASTVCFVALSIIGSIAIGSQRGDRYKSFEELSKIEVLNRDYRIDVESRGSEVTILAIHGGRIEFGTSEIATAVADPEFSLYLFEGISSSNNWRLHITSSSFDEPQALRLVADTRFAISIHGFKEDSIRLICVGGMNTSVAEKIAKSLAGSNSWKVDWPCLRFPADTKDNIVNRAKAYGVQFELSSLLRKDLIADPALLKLFSKSIRAVLLEEMATMMNVQ